MSEMSEVVEILENSSRSKRGLVSKQDEIKFRIPVHSFFKTCGRELP